MTKISRRSFFKLSGSAIAAGVVPLKSVEASPLGNWVKCEGQLLKRKTYHELFKNIGTLYGEGDGKTTFNIPDMSNYLINVKRQKDQPYLCGNLVEIIDVPAN